MWSIMPVSNDGNSPTTQWLCRASNQWGAEVNALEDRMEKEISTKDVCNAIRMNKGLFNEEASLPLTFPLPIQFFHYSEWEVRAAGPQSWVYCRLGLPGSKHNQIICHKDIFHLCTSCKGQALMCKLTTAGICCYVMFSFSKNNYSFYYLNNWCVINQTSLC